jgi:hypothetical protein
VKARGRYRRFAQIRFDHSLGTETIEKQEQALLSTRPSGRGSQIGQFRFETLRAEGLATASGACIADDLMNAVINSDGAGIGLNH